ncbi:MAG: AMP phosphorylase [Candidatus Micrarchaeota archaeon]
MKHEYKVKKIDLNAGGKPIVVMNNDDASNLAMSAMDRICIYSGSKKLTALIDLSETYIPKGSIGTFSSVSKKLNISSGDKVMIEPIGNPDSVLYIRKKLEGRTLTKDEIDAIILDVLENNLSDIEITAFIVAIYARGMNHDETVFLTKAIADSGSKLDFGKKQVFSKHCIGGVPGNKTSMIVIPIVACAGLIIPKTSSRSITSPAGTADAMEVLAPVSLNEKQIEKVVHKTNACLVWGGGVNLAAADDNMIKVRHPLHLDPRPLLLASILGKKKAEGATHVLIDIPMGAGTKIFSRAEAESLAKDFMEIGSALGIEVHCIITPGYDPIGYAIGPALEAREVMRILEGEKVSEDLIDKSLVMAGLLLEIAGKAQAGSGKKMAKEILESGKALQKMKDIIREQGGSPHVTSRKIQVGQYTHDFISDDTGRVHLIRNHDISAVARVAGAPKDRGAGIYMYVEKGDKVKKGQKIFTIYADCDYKLAAAVELANKINPIEMDKVVLEEFSAEVKPHVYDLKDL